MRPEEFLRHAAECLAMAKISRDQNNKLVWRQMAQRWENCAELAKRRGQFTPKKERKYVNVGTCSIYSQ